MVERSGHVDRRVVVRPRDFAEAQRREVLAQVPLFAGLAPEHLEALAAALQQRRYAPGEVIFHEDDPGGALFIIEEGQVKIRHTSVDGKELILTLVSPGDFFGELALLDGEPRSADAVAVGLCRLLLLQRPDFVRVIEAHPPAALALLGTLARRFRRLDRFAQDMAFLDVPGRLARVLLHLAETQGDPALQQGEVRLTARFTQAEIAVMVGVSRESANKWLRLFSDQGLLRHRQGRLTILDPQGLRAQIV
jgi:CRP-like cAMP-binding protein